jgi:pullulanase-type alpha-1,6-glucosidase
MWGGARGTNATQFNMAGTGIATFNDRLRDAVRGGGAFGNVQEQGILTGLLDAPNEAERRPADERHARLLESMDRLRVGVAGNLALYAFLDRQGARVEGRHVDHNGAPCGYAAQPVETVNYVEAHDNETLLDAIQMKAPSWLPLSERVRMHRLGMALVALSQGIPFFHAGMELLRSKSLDRNSYDSGDWFNRVDWTGGESTWGSGLPPAPDNQNHWWLHGRLLATPGLAPSAEDMRNTAVFFRALLRIRRSTRLFRLRTADEVARCLSMINTGPRQRPGLLAFSLRDPEGVVDDASLTVVVLVNTLGQPLVLEEPSCRGLDLRLHPALAATDDPLLTIASHRPATGAFHVPGRTALVYWTRE